MISKFKWLIFYLKKNGNKIFDASYTSKNPKSSKSVQIGMVIVKATHPVLNNPNQYDFQP
jgi:hypothetical protein